MVVVFRFRRYQVTLGFDMEANRFAYRGREISGQVIAGQVAVIVDTVLVVRLGE